MAGRDWAITSVPLAESGLRADIEVNIAMDLFAAIAPGAPKARATLNTLVVAYGFSVHRKARDRTSAAYLSTRLRQCSQASSIHRVKCICLWFLLSGFSLSNGREARLPCCGSSDLIPRQANSGSGSETQRKSAADHFSEIRRRSSCYRAARGGWQDSMQ